MIEAGIQYKIVPDRIRDGPQISDGIFAGEWLGEMPEFACDHQPCQGCEIERVWPNSPRRIMPLVCSEKMLLMSKWKPARSSLSRINALFLNVPMSISGAGLA
jgi:hypothetical protein